LEIHEFCEKCAVFAEDSYRDQNMTGMKVVPREEFDKIGGYIQSDEKYPSLTVRQILDMTRQCPTYNEFIEFLKTKDLGAKATVKFFGELQHHGHDFTSMQAGSMQPTRISVYKCSNPSCHFEKELDTTAGHFPRVQNVSGRHRAHPGELPPMTEEDHIIQQKLKAHVGSAVMGNAEIKKEVPVEKVSPGVVPEVNTVNPEMESGQIEEKKDEMVQ